MQISPAQPPANFNEREVKSQASSLDKAGVWSLDFRFKDPRLIKVHVPGRGTRIYWYLWYQVINHTGAPPAIQWKLYSGPGTVTSSFIQ